MFNCNRQLKQKSPIIYLNDFATFYEQVCSKYIQKFLNQNNKIGLVKSLNP